MRIITLKCLTCTQYDRIIEFWHQMMRLHVSVMQTMVRQIQVIIPRKGERRSIQI